MRRRIGLTATLALMLVTSGGSGAAETVRLGVSRLASCAPIAMALAKGYFAAEGLDPRLTYFDAQQPIAVAVTSGDLDFGIAAETAALFNLANGGKLRIIGGGASEAPTFHYLSILASNDAYAKGLTSPRELAGHSLALTQMGSGLQYLLSRIALKYGFDVKTVKLLPLQSNSNIASALAGGRADSAIFNSSGTLPLLARGDAKLLGWVGDSVGLDQAYLFFASAKMADEHGATVQRLLTAVRKGALYYHDAFTDPQDKRHDGSTAPDALAILAAYVNQPVDQIKEGLPYFDTDLRIDVADVQDQIDWYHAQGFLKDELSAGAVIDKRYAILRPPGRESTP